jgi:hypothetical protein
MQRQRPQQQPPRDQIDPTFLPYRIEAVPYVPRVLSLSLMHGRCQLWPDGTLGTTVWFRTKPHWSKFQEPLELLFRTKRHWSKFQDICTKRVSESEQHWPGDRRHWCLAPISVPLTQGQSIHILSTCQVAMHFLYLFSRVRSARYVKPSRT